MKQYIKGKLRKLLLIESSESIIGEDYPMTWNIEEFKNLTSFNTRIKYCEEHLVRISSGSSRIVYKIDDEKVLKLAKNRRGLAQNEIEIEHSQYKDLDSILAKVFNYDENNLWVEMELANKLNYAKFKEIVGIDFKVYGELLYNHGVDNSVSNKYAHNKYDIPQEIVEWSWEDEFIYEIYDYIGSYNTPTGDLIRLSTYGVVKRDGADTVVIIDYGLDQGVHSNYYS